MEEPLRQYDIEDLHNFLRQFELVRGLETLSLVSAHLWKTGKPFKYFADEAFSEWQTGFLAQELIRVGLDSASLKLDQDNAIVRVMHLANGLRDYFQLNDTGTVEYRRELRRSFWYRVANEQFGSQAKRWYLIPRYFAMFDNLARTNRRGDEPDLAAEFQTTCQLSIPDFMKIGFAILTRITELEEPRFLAADVLRSDVETMRTVLTPEKVDSFLSSTSLTVEEFRTELANQASPPRGLEKHWLNPLWRHPIVNTGLGYVVPSVWLLVQRFTSGIYFDFLDQRLDDRRAILGFTSLFGRIFEDHVGKELACHFEPDELKGQQQYWVRKSAWSGPDWAIIEGRRATLIECKTSRMTKIERERAEIPMIRKHLRKDIIPAIKRFPQKAAHIRKRVKGLEDWPEIDDFEFVILSLDPWWPELLTKQIIAEELSADPAKDVRYHLMWVEQLEHLGSFRSGTTIFDLLRRRWDVALNWDTRTYMFEEANRLGLALVNSRMDQVAEDFFKQMVPEEGGTYNAGE